MRMRSGTKLCPSLCYSVDCSLPGSSVHGISQAQEEYRSGLPFPPLGDLPDPRIEPMSLTFPTSLILPSVSLNSLQLIHYLFL